MVDVYYTSDFSSYDEGFYFKYPSVGELAEIAQKLEYETGQLFYSGAYSKRLGCFEYSMPQPCSEAIRTPFVFEINRNKVLFKIEQEFRELIIGDLTVHLIAYDKYHEIILDQVFLIEGKEKQYSFDIDITMEGNPSYEYWVFDNEGKLIDRNSQTFIERAFIDSKTVVKSYTLSAENFSNKNHLRNENLEVNIGYPGKIEVNLAKDIQNNIYRYMDSLYQNLKNYSTNEEKDGQWFKKHADEKELINYFNKITNAPNCEMIIIDPYITAHSLNYLLTLENITLKLKLISCLHKTNPDNRELYLEGENVITRLNDYKNYQIPLNNLKWHVLKENKFHDRIIYIKNTQVLDEDSEQVYLLSNSLNGMLINYDWCIVPLQKQTKRMALEYITSLLDGLNDCILMYPAINDK